MDEGDRTSTGSGISLDSQVQTTRLALNTAGRVHSSPTTLSPQGVSHPDISANVNCKSQSDSEVANVSSPSAIPTRISSSSDIGYGSMQKVSTDDITNAEGPTETQAKAAKFWGRMGSSLDQVIMQTLCALNLTLLLTFSLFVVG